MMPMIAALPVAPPEPPQALSRAQFVAALAFHGFAAMVGPFDLAFVDWRTRRRYPGCALRMSTPDGQGHIDRLATLQALLAWRREILARRRLRRARLRRLLTLRLPVRRPAGVALGLRLR